jgi:hypothetical protein
VLNSSIAFLLIVLFSSRADASDRKISGEMARRKRVRSSTVRHSSCSGRLAARTKLALRRRSQRLFRLDVWTVENVSPTLEHPTRQQASADCESREHRKKDHHEERHPVIFDRWCTQWCALVNANSLLTLTSILKCHPIPAGARYDPSAGWHGQLFSACRIRAAARCSPVCNQEVSMITTRQLVALLVAVGLASTPFAANAKKHRRAAHYHSTVPSGYYGTAGVTMPRSGTYGSSGVAIGTVTAPSVGTYNWPSVGVTNARPTWSNTNPR